MAGDKLELLAANDSSYYLYDKKSKGSFGSKKTRRDEITDVTAVGSQISSGGDLTLLSGGDQTYQGAKLESGNDLATAAQPVRRGRLRRQLDHGKRRTPGFPGP